MIIMITMFIRKLYFFHMPKEPRPRRLDAVGWRYRVIFTAPAETGVDGIAGRGAPNLVHC